MNESVQKIVTDLMQGQPCSGGFLPTGPAVRLSESEVGIAVSALIWSVVGHVDDGKTGNYLAQASAGSSLRFRYRAVGFRRDEHLVLDQHAHTCRPAGLVAGKVRLLLVD